MKRLGVQAYRFSVAWPRILPQGQGSANEPGLSFYDRLIDELLTAGIQPWLCLYHWDLPQALEDLGGWMNRESAAWFADYTRLVATRFGDRVKHFATFNEPSIFSLFGRSLGKRDRSSEDNLHRTIHHVNLAHGAAVDVLREKIPGASIGCIHNYQPCWPSSRNEADAAAAARLDVYWNKAFPDPQCRGEYPPLIRPAIEPHMQSGDMARICRPVDWFGLNHYSPVYVKAQADSMLGFDFGEKPAFPSRRSDGRSIPKRSAKRCASSMTATSCRSTFSKTDWAISTSPTRQEQSSTRIGSRFCAAISGR
jgi:beta-glucosidase